MRVGLIDIEPKVVNTALMQIAYYHRQLGDVVEWAAPLCYGQFDKLYCSSLFDYTLKDIPARTIRGGTGFDLTTDLPFDCDYDYSIYPNCDYSIVWFSRGCIRNCPFCVVRQKEGNIRSVEAKTLNPKGKYLVVQDNNFFASPKWHLAASDLILSGLPIDFNGGIDVRILKQNQLLALNRLRLHKQIYIAWDNPEDDLRPHIERMTAVVKPYKIACYVLIGYWSTPKQDLYRVETLRELKIDPFVMPYDKSDYYQRRFARWVNHKAIFKKVGWADYKS